MRSAAVSGVTEPRGLLFSASEMRASVFAKWVRALRGFAQSPGKFRASLVTCSVDPPCVRQGVLVTAELETCTSTPKRTSKEQSVVSGHCREGKYVTIPSSLLSPM